MNIKYFIPVLAIVLTLFSCNDGKQQVAELTDQVMDIHDEAMEHMMEMKMMKLNLEKQLEEGNANAALDSTQIVQLHTSVEALEKAESHMRQWLRDYEAPHNMPAEEALTYLGAQLKDIQLVSKEVNESMALAKPLMKEDTPKNDENETTNEE